MSGHIPSRGGRLGALAVSSPEGGPSPAPGPRRLSPCSSAAFESFDVFLATSPAQYPAGSGVGVSVLLRQPHGFEGFGVIPEELDSDDLALAHRDNVRHLDVPPRAVA
jgi:hypothetical protein